MGNAVIKSSGMKKVEDELQTCERKNKKLIGKVNSLKTKIDDLKENDLEALNNICEECEKEEKSVKENLILSGFKICNSCRVSKTVFPV